MSRNKIGVYALKGTYTDENILHTSTCTEDRTIHAVHPVNPKHLFLETKMRRHLKS